MRRRTYLSWVAVVVILTLVWLTGCTADELPTDRETFISSLQGTWEVNENSAIIIDNQDVTHLFEGFVISIEDDLSFTTNSDQLTITEFPWPVSGFFLLNDDLNQMTRNDGLTIDISIDEENEVLDLQFTIDEETGRSSGIKGKWHCMLKSI